MNPSQLNQFRVIFPSILEANAFRSAIRNGEIRNAFLAPPMLPMGMTPAERACEVTMQTSHSATFFRSFVAGIVQRHKLSQPHFFSTYEGAIGAPLNVTTCG